MRSALPPSDARVRLGWHAVVAGPPRQPSSAFDPSAAPPVAPLSAVGEAISLGTTVVSMGRPPLAAAPGSIDIVSPVRFEAWNWDAFNFNPRKNQGRQIDLFLAGPIDDPLEQRWLVDEEISGPRHQRDSTTRADRAAGLIPLSPMAAMVCPSPSTHPT